MSINEEIELIVEDKISQIPMPKECSITKNYEDSFADIKTNDGDVLTNVKVIGNNSVGETGVLIFLNHTNNRYVVITGKGAELIELIQRFGFNQPHQEKFNFCVRTTTETARDGSTIQNEEYWILSNCYYDYNKGRFIKLDGEHTSFGIQIQANGTYPGEAALGYSDNVGINVWRNPKKSDVEISFPNWRDDPVNDFYPFFEKNQIGLGKQNDPDYWREFGVYCGWTNSFMIDSYGGMTVGGSGFEIDGNGIFPYTRVTSSRYADPDTGMAFNLLGLLDNAYHPTAYLNQISPPEWLGTWKCDNNSTYSWFFGFKTPTKTVTEGGVTTAEDLVKDNSQTKFVIMYNDTSPNPSDVEEIDMSKWHTILEVSPTEIRAIVDGALTTLGSGGSSGGEDDSGWIDLTLNPNFYNFDADNKVQYRKYGKTVQITGLPVLNAYPSVQQELIIGNVPSGFRPARNVSCVCELKDSIKLCSITVKSNGDVCFNNLRDNTGFISGTAFSDVISLNTTYLI